MQDELLVSLGERPKRLDHYLAGHLRDISRAQLQRLIILGRIRVQGRRAKPSLCVRGGDRIEVDRPPPSPLRPPNNFQGSLVLDEDEDVVVLNKPAGVVMHPGSGHWDDTILNA